MKYCVLGAGSWGTTFAQMLKDEGKEVCVWARREEVVELINREGRNPYTGDLALSVRATGDVNECIDFSNVVVIAIPTQHIREILETIRVDVRKVLNLSKGLEISTGKRISQIVSEVLNAPYCVLSGPSHAEEVMRKLPTAVTVAGDFAEEVQHDLNTRTFRVYTVDDVVGVEIAGALKNVMAIAAGILDGLGGWDNAKAALMTRALYEMVKYGVQFGAKPYTFMGLAGIGDLMVTCNSRYSRNRWFGERIGNGENPQALLSSMKMVAEGAYTVKAVVKMAEKLGLDMPISREVYKIIYEGKSPLASMKDLMSRAPKPEMEILKELKEF